MNKQQRATRNRFREHYAFHTANSVRKLTYPVWLEKELVRREKEYERLQRYTDKKVSSLSAVAYYIHDMEKGMEIVDRSAKTLEGDDGLVVTQAIRWLKNTVAEARQVFTKCEYEDQL